ncbi:hypothetical protein BGX24_004495 [Mortierella sp. AD032]|nr:hypothetical protein BGX24_004495 [Mortierella sp. AD032]
MTKQEEKEQPPPSSSPTLAEPQDETTVINTTITDIDSVSVSNASKSLQPQPHRVLRIPELMAHIFAFLSPYVVIQHASLVCHDWCNFSRRFCPLPPVVALWTPHLSETEVSALFGQVLPSAKILHIGSLKDRLDDGVGDRTEGGYKAVWDDLLKMVGMLMRREKNEEMEKRSTIFRLVVSAYPELQSPAVNASQQQSMQESQPGGSIQPTVENLLGRLVMFASRLTELKIENISVLNQYSIDIDVVVDSCPTLRELALEGRVTPIEVNTRNAVQVGLSKDHTLWARSADDRPLALQTLTIKNLLVSQRFLDTMVSACPDLHKLELSAIYLGERAKGSTDSYILEPPRRIEFFHHIGRSCPKLEYIQVSHGGHLLRDVQHFKDVFATTPHWAFNRADFHDQSLGDFLFPRQKHVIDFPQICLRGFEIHPEGAHAGLHTALHTFLTSPSAATLVHLKILGANYPVSYFESGFQAPENAWTCTNLETLHLHSHPEYGVLSPTIQGPANQWLSRHFFIGLSGTFSKMKDLRIDCPNIDFSLEGGMCLLRRMSNLERVRIKSMREAPFTERDLAWLIPDPTSEQRLQNANIFLALQTQILVYRGGSSRRNVQRIRDQSIAGTMEYIVDLLQEIQTRGVAGRCLPYLESLIIEQGGKWDTIRHASEQKRTRELVKRMQGTFFFHLTMDGAPPKLGVGP